MIKSIHHVQIAVAREFETATIDFYKNKLGLEEIPKPENLKKNGGSWFMIGTQQFHIAPEDNPFEYNSESKRHACFIVEDIIQAEKYFKERNIDVIPDKQPIKGWKRFYFRDPAGNRMECAEVIDE